MQLRKLNLLNYEPSPTEYRPRTRGECVDGPRPCPWVSCRHHLYLDVLPAGELVMQYADLEPHELKHSCALDVAARGEHTLDELGAVLGCSKEQARQLTLAAIGQCTGELEHDLIPDEHDRPQVPVRHSTATRRGRAGARGDAE